MMRKLVCLFAMVAAAVALGGCGKKTVVDPYAKASLREAMYGEVVSEGFMYKFVNPQIIDTLGNFVVVRQGNLTQFITANGIAPQVAKVGELSNLTFNVVKRFRPMVYFQCMSIVSAKDSILCSSEKPMAFPRTADAATFAPPPDYTDVAMSELRYDDTGGLQAMVGKKFSTRAKLVRVEGDSAAVWMLEGEKPCPSPFLRTPQRVTVAKLRVKTPRPSLEIVMRMLGKTEQDFVGGFTFASVEPLPNRAENQICGTVEVGYVRFLDIVYMR
jgi:hypothetical protein